MALTNSDLEKIGKVVDGRLVAVLEQVVFPELMKIEKKMATKDDIAAIRKEMATKQDIVDSEERLTKQIDKLAEVITDTKTNHERRIRNLEDEVGVEPVERLTA